ARGMTRSVDPASAAPLAALGPRRFLEWTRGLELCFPNLDEGRLLAGAESPEAVGRELARWYGGVGLKLGAAGALWATAGGPPQRRAALPARVVDTTGAGDAFCAGFLSAWLRGRSPAAALEQGLRLAAVAVGRLGARP